ncbi:MAG: hypothetical protein A3E82_02000 [Gammaproteobacteria bacterium RIFCSPHIGHO2_12_FULL_38_11]|nr:MAG: hypothetical protein A3E82_02000 [Gammaproteobacteria bacterium RIFCSPHIGHO2_12_FULL_38_11]
MLTARKTSQCCEWIALMLLTSCFFVSPISVSLTTITYLGAFIFLLLSGDWRARWERIKNNKAAMSFWLLFALLIVGIFYSASTPQFIFKDIQKRHYLLMTPFFMMIIQDEQWRQRMINAFLFAMIVTLFFSSIQTIFHVRFSNSIHLLRHQFDISSVFVDHIVQSFAMNIAAFICAYRFFFKKKNRMAYLIFFILMAVNIMLMNKGRTGYGIFLLLCFYLSVIRFGWKGIAVTGLLSVVACLFVLYTPNNFHARLQKMHYQYGAFQKFEKRGVLMHHQSVIQRIEMWKISKKMIKKRPWFGYGTGGIEAQLPKIIPAKERVFNKSLNYVESDYLNFILAFGFVGLAVFLFVIFLQIKTTFQLPHPYRCLMQATLIALLFGGIFNGFLISFSVSHFYALLSAVCFSALCNSRRDEII